MKTLAAFIANIVLISLISAQEPSINIIKNGSFDNNLEVRKTGSTVYSWGSYDEPLRLAEFFDEATQATYPTLASTTMPDYVWFQRNPVHYNGRVFINTTTNSANSNRALSLYNVGDATKVGFTESPFDHVAAQRVDLDNSAVYQLDFDLQKKTQIWASGTLTTPPPLRENKIRKFVVGIIASNETENSKNYTYYQEVTLPEAGDDTWHHVTVTFDLPAIIAANPGRDFTKAAILFGMQVYTYDGTTGYGAGEVIIDDVKLRRTPVEEPPVSTSLIGNGGFEEFNDFSVSDQLVYMTGPFFAPLRSIAVFGQVTQSTYPNRGKYPVVQYTFPVPNKKWYNRSPDNNKGNARVVVNYNSNTPEGDNCITLYNVGGTDGTTTHSVLSTSPFNHMVVQKVALANANKYKLSFIYQKPDLIWSTNNTLKANNVPSKFVVGIVASNETANNSEFTYYEEFTVPLLGDETWHTGEITFNIPTIIANNPGRDFSNAAIFFGMQSQGLDTGSGSKAGAMNIDNAVLTDITNITSVDQSTSDKNIHSLNVQNKNLTISDIQREVCIYNVSGVLLYKNNASKTIKYTFDNSGVYVVKVDGKTHKVFVK